MRPGYYDKGRHKVGIIDSAVAVYIVQMLQLIEKDYQHLALENNQPESGFKQWILSPSENLILPFSQPHSSKIMHLNNVQN